MILKAYGVLNGIVGFIFGLSLVAKEELSEIGVGVIAAVLVVSFGVYAFGEVVSLLSDIRANTGASASASAPAQPAAFDDLPEL